VIHPSAPPSVLGGGVGHLVEGHIVKALAEASYVVPILSEVEPHDGILILKGDLEPEDLRPEVGRRVVSQRGVVLPAA
jgi:hypothetical protein